jgi:hypothetical protein
MIIVQVVVNLWGVELSSISQWFSSDWAPIFLRNTTLIVAEMIYIVLFSIFLELI